MLRSALLLQILFICLFSPPGICLSKTWRCTKFKYLSLNPFQKQVAFYIDLYNFILVGPLFLEPLHYEPNAPFPFLFVRADSLKNTRIPWGNVLCDGEMAQMSRGT